MTKSTFGATSLHVPPLCMGTMTFGDGADERVCRSLYRQCRDRGINFFDCANVYADGEAEQILGRLIQGHRTDVIVTTKAYYPMRGDLTTRGTGRKQLIAALDASLARLGTSYVDIFFLHAFDPSVPMEESIGTVNDFIGQGKVHYLGVSNFAAWQVMKAQAVAQASGFDRVSCIQPMYNLIKRQAESELFPMAESERLGVLSYSPLAGGLLTGKYAKDNLAIGRLVTSPMYRERYAGNVAAQAAAEFADLAREISVAPASLAIAWVAAHPAVTAPIIGARTVEQLDAALGSLDVRLTPELRARISNLTPTPAIATDRSEEQA